MREPFPPIITYYSILYPFASRQENDKSLAKAIPECKNAQSFREGNRTRLIEGAPAPNFTYGDVMMMMQTSKSLTGPILRTGDS